MRLSTVEQPARKEAISAANPKQSLRYINNNIISSDAPISAASLPPAALNRSRVHSWLLLKRMFHLFSNATNRISWSYKTKEAAWTHTHWPLDDGLALGQTLQESRNLASHPNSLKSHFGQYLKTATQTIWKSADQLIGMRSLFGNPQIELVFLLYRIGVFAVCAATIVAASALFWLTHFTIRNPFVTRWSESLERRRGKKSKAWKWSFLREPRKRSSSRLKTLQRSLSLSEACQSSGANFR